jgi:uncharacterized membrane protein YphA (DoxX/SURF4 family)
MASAGAIQIGSGVASDLPAERRAWRTTTLILFRLAFVYMPLYLVIPLLGIVSQPLLHTRSVVIAAQRIWTPLSAWAANALFRARQFDPSFYASDSVLGWALAGLLALIAVVGAVIWSALDRKRRNYDGLHAWLRLVIRLVLGMTLIVYGAQKFWPAQMPLIRPHQLLGELGSYSRSQLLWVFVGASPGYERFTGSVEVLAGMLLFVPQLTTLAALVATLAMTQVVALNVFYDVQVKLFSFHLLLMALFLLIPDLQRLRDFALNRPTVAPEPPRLFQSARAARITSVAQIIVGAVATASIVPFSHTAAQIMNVSDISRVPYYGVWDVQDFSLDGISYPPLISDETRWQRLVFDDYFTASIQRMNGRVIVARLLKNPADGTMTLTYAGDARSDISGAKWRAVLHADTTSHESLVLQGQLNGRALSLRLQRSTIQSALEPYETHWVLRERRDL